MFVENNSYRQIGNAYRQHDITVGKADGNIFRVTNDNTSEIITLVSNSFAYCFEEGRLATRRGSDLEHNKYIGEISTIMRVVGNKDGEILSHFDKIDETQDGIKNSCLKHMLINNHEVEANRVRNKGYLNLEEKSGFCKTFKKMSENLGFRLTFKTADLQDIIYTTIGDSIDTTNNNFCSFVPAFIPSAETQAMFNESIRNNFTLSFDSWYTDRKVVNDGLEFQADFGSAQNINSPKYSVAANQALARIRVPTNANRVSGFDNLVIGK